MSKSKIIQVVFGIIALVLLIAINVFIYQKKEEQDFLNTLQGTIVYTYRTDNYVSDVYTISANGRNKKLIYHNTDAVNSNSSYPMWFQNGTKIHFTAMKNGRWKTFSIDEDGKNLTELDEPPYIMSFPSRAKDIKVQWGGVYYIDINGNRNKVYYNNKNYYPNQDATEANWSPDKKYIIFAVNGGVMVTNIEGTHAVEVTKGLDPDWKY